jgi:Fuc2NAc and GlcNAc transferase
MTAVLVCLLAGLSLAVSMALTLAVRRFAIAHGLLDVPNERSSHVIPTPRGGGVAIVLTSVAGFVLLAALHKLDFSLFAALMGGLGVAAIGFRDDRRALPAAVRLGAHLAAALWALAWLGGLPPLQIGHQVVTLGLFGNILGALSIVWVLNLFNFMDGIDGLAASEAVFIVWSGAILAGATNGPAAAAIIFGASCLGFLRWNWPPAKIFLGDVGSGFAGYVIAVLALGVARRDPVGLWTWLILGGVFFVDATLTLVRRLLRWERIYEAHRTHAYQWLARRWNSHGRVTSTVLAVNILGLFPCAMLAHSFPEYAGLLVFVAFVPLSLLAADSGAGRREQVPPPQ